MTDLPEAEKARPVLPEKWYFYNLKQSIDDPYKPFSAATLDSISGTFGESLLESSSSSDASSKEPSPSPIAEVESQVPLYSNWSIRRTISPIVEWTPFNPCDNKALNKETTDEPVAVGHERHLFQVHNHSSLRPIYWSIPYSTKVCGVRWVFSDTLTPIDPKWDEGILPHFTNFANNVDTYVEVLEKAVNEPSMMKVISQRIDVKQAGTMLKLELLFSPKNNWVYLFKADSSYICTKQTALSLLSGSIARGVLAVLKPFNFDEYKKYMSLPDRPSDDPDYEPLPVNNLILVFHGVGQKLSNSYSRINFVYAIDKLRVEIQQASESPDVYSHFPGSDKSSFRTLVLPVNWRNVFNASDNFNVSAITVPSMLSIRQAFSDALLDIPLYMSENRRPQMLAAAASEANRLHALVKKHHPSFEKEGRTHLIGHSLGSLITADLLTHQPTEFNEQTEKDAPFKFQTYNYFTTGSMLGVFMVLKGKHLLPRSEFDAKQEAGAPSNPRDRPFGCFAVKNIYNIIHQSDLLSFLANGTVQGAQHPDVSSLCGLSGLPLEADELPSSNQPQSSANNGDTPPGTPPLQSSLSSGLYSSSSRLSLSRFFGRFSKDEVTIDPSEVEEHTDEMPEAIEQLLTRFQHLNENGQLDYKLPQAASYIPRHYLKMFTAHFDYWSNKEMARFLAIECGREPGQKNTLPEHRVKWKYKIKDRAK